MEVELPKVKEESWKTYARTKLQVKCLQHNHELASDDCEKKWMEEQLEDLNMSLGDTENNTDHYEQKYANGHMPYDTLSLYFSTIHILPIWFDENDNPKSHIELPDYINEYWLTIKDEVIGGDYINE